MEGLPLIFIPKTSGLISWISKDLMPLLAVIAVILLIFMMLFAFASGEKEVVIPQGLKYTFAVLIAFSE